MNELTCNFPSLEELGPLGLKPTRPSEFNVLSSYAELTAKKLSLAPLSPLLVK
jgi:hypothetical protein